MLRLDVPHAEAAAGEPPFATQFYSPNALYCVTPTDEETARRVAGLSRVAPVARWELPPGDEEPHDAETVP